MPSDLLIRGLMWTLPFLAAGPLLLTLWNLRLLRPTARVRADSGNTNPDFATRQKPSASILIPARNEVHNIDLAITAALASTLPGIEVIVLDDHSTDGTGDAIERWTRIDKRVTRLRPDRFAANQWGKPQACAQLADAARGDVLIFVDADVRLGPDAIERIVYALQNSGAAMLSGVPAQVTRSWPEKLVVPLIQFVLLGFLPIAAMRRSIKPEFGAACGQLLAVDSHAYRKVGGHKAVAHRIHDGLALARQLRHGGFRTDLADFTDLATCRMYFNLKDVVDGFAKNAHEGLGSPRGLVPWTLILLGGQCAGPMLLVTGTDSILPAALATAFSYTNRLLLTARFRLSLTGALLHPVSVAMLVAIQWYALFRRTTGNPVAWKARTPSC